MNNNAIFQKNQQQRDILGGTVASQADRSFYREVKERPPSGVLSNAHILPQGRASFWIGGSKVKFSKPKPQLKGKHAYGIRGQVTKFTRASRRRLLYKLAEVEKENLPQFLTLTYPNEYPEVEVAKKHFQQFIKRLKRKFPDLALFWKLEPQKRGAPHFHCLVWGLPGWSALYIVACHWYQIAGGGDQNHLLFHLGGLDRSQPCLQPVKSWRGVMAYAAKYLGKEIIIEGWKTPGRFWGVAFRQSIPWARLVSIATSYKGAVNLIRALRRYSGMKARNYRSLTGFVNDPGFWREKFNQLAYEGSPP